MPLGSGFAHPSTSGESIAREIGVGPELRRLRLLRFGGSEVAQPPGELRRPHISVAASDGPELVAPETEEEEEDDGDSIVSSPQVVGKTYTCLTLSSLPA